MISTGMWAVLRTRSTTSAVASTQPLSTTRMLRERSESAASSLMAANVAPILALLVEGRDHQVQLDV